MNNRRYFFKQCLAGSAAIVGSSSLLSCSSGDSSLFEKRYKMRAEESVHLRTWMAFGGGEEIWGNNSLSVRQALASIANAIVAFEPVSMLVRPEDIPQAQVLLDPRVSILSGSLNDLWMRDTSPVFVFDESDKPAGVDFNFNGWGNKPAFRQPFSNDQKVAAEVCNILNIPRVTTSLVLEGGALEVDGEGTAIITESCVLNPNRNPELSKQDCEAKLSTLLGVSKIIWLPGIKHKDITDGHTDFYARFVAPGVVVAHYDADTNSYDHSVTLQHLDILRNATDVKGRKLTIEVLEGAHTTRITSPHFAAGYVNFYICNGAVICPQFGDTIRDEAARQMLVKYFPSRQIVQLNIDAIANGGGGIHCTTQEQVKGSSMGF